MHHNLYVKFNFIIILFVLSSVTYSQSRFFPLKKTCPDNWKSDSLFVGGKIKAVGGNVRVVWKKTSVSAPSGILYFIKPGQSDSALQLFHNKINEFPNDKGTIDLGDYQQNTPLVFRYIVIDTMRLISSIKNRKLYSGTNIEGVDTYVSEIPNASFGKKWAIAGQIDSTTVEAGFSVLYGYSFDDVIFWVYGAKVEK